MSDAAIPSLFLASDKSLVRGTIYMQHEKGRSRKTQTSNVKWTLAIAELGWGI
jgi:hypothetical protein